ncbi:ABC transporter permease subunit [Rossellomorea aquimaris]|uniref:ABC transporter permease subunit n=1 Tax=Rossellomorea aquimaris TaxID=189382 RepID=A0A5D4TBI1_9BACI|nr:ABC transporter permease subunit [Rossellomorea aquimaris]TYS72625.1 ABC transporter permease subunit [Rossellomorea aquimaris]TYS77266.1 ABC transporter permease subunit [Rossellomorea aquimaris]
MRLLTFPLKFMFYYILGLIGILAVSIAPEVFKERGLYNFVGFLEEFFKFVFVFLDGENWSYSYKGITVDFLDMLWGPYLYSLQIIGGALGLGLGIAFILTIYTVFMPRWVTSSLKKVLNLFETVPDLMFAFMLQLLIVYVIKYFGVELMNFTEYGEEKIFLAPIITLSIIPMISFFRILLFITEEEMLKPHVEFAQSKGMSKGRILFAHILKNISPSLFYHGKLIIWGMLSSLFIIETIFNMRGITYYIVQDFRPMVIAISLIMIYTPFFVVYQGVYLWINREGSVDHTKYKRDKTKWNEWKIWGWLSTICRLWWQHMHNGKFAIGFSVIFLLIALSFLYPMMKEDPIKQIQFMKNDEGRIISAPPHKPFGEMILGSDFFGYSILDQLIVGAKYTLLFALVVASLRVIGGFYLGIAYHFHLKENRKNWLDRMVDSIHFLPLSLIAYLLLRPVLWGLPVLGWDHSIFERLVFEAVVLTILVLPLTTVLIGNELKLLGKQDFVLSAKLLGGSNRHLLWTHLFPHLAPRLFIIWGQQFIQTLLILVHLGLFHLFLGGTIITGGLVPDPPKSGTFEWSGLISSTKDSLMTGKYWIVIAPLAAFMIAIIAMQLIVQGVKEIQQTKVGVLVNNTPIKNKHKLVKKKTYRPVTEDFHLVRQQSFKG